jgi:phosphoribosylamine--glycine ligase
MGAYSPTAAVPAKLKSQVEEIFARTLAGLKAEGIKYQGVLYAGLMVTDDGLKVLEFNARFGDPETQVVVPRMDFDLFEAMQAVVDGRLKHFPMRWRPEAAICVVVASGGYPGEFSKGKEIRGLSEAQQTTRAIVFHAGTRRRDTQAPPAVLTDGGRVLGVTALGSDLRDAQREAYRAIEKIQFDGMHFRKDIGYRELARNTDQ